MTSAFKRSVALYLARYQDDLLVVAGRIVLASFLLLASYPILFSALVDHDLISPLPLDTLLRVVFFGYALLMLAVVWLQRRPASPRFGRFACIVDMLFAVAMLSLAGGSTSETLVFFIFILGSAALRWQRPGLNWTATTLLILHFTISAGSAVLFGHSLPIAIIDALATTGLLGAIVVLIWAFTVPLERARREQMALATWPRNIVSDAAHDMLARTIARIFDAPRVLLIWEEADEPWCYTLYYNQGEVRFGREEPDLFDPLVSTALTDCHFLSPTVASGQAILVYTNGELTTWRGRPLNASLVDYYGIRDVLCLQLSVGSLNGRLFVMDKTEDMTSEDLTLGAIVARRTATDLWQMQLQNHLQTTVANEERERLARDLHDGLLQSLTGIALRLETARRQLQRAPAGAAKLLEQVQQTVVSEQRDLREIVRGLKASSLYAELATMTLTSRLSELAGNVGSSWKISVDLDLPPDPPTLPPALEEQLYRIAQEALNNAGRHSGGDRVRLRYAVDGTNAYVVCSDNGHGFPFRGRHDLADLEIMNAGPMLLKKRVAALGGALVVESTDHGTTLEVSVPRPEQPVLQKTAP